ncbi:hypothetical protein A2715_00260 [Candidatus Woesebacteria bacterium RIFCSPHIGHO2_01_FULL_39_32]|uniref:Uncharacterized protein n=2 Tax=Candidatus Woeseibacteriota TaxID=1752722 RepID=A0A0G0PR53_9BACT|nr:MAG: hypothetical protein UT61_C0004G0031 [Candidatus Woesebacteria bacterium GW2011_GWA1_39_8]OGM03793.1 MAG: hypothetical protein A2124_00380 [Candidatus Woesebacteria bacterium GWB1_37_5]OGM24258.1 MAG: hypothetical protein A2715_00260 [Candidatus Woesebacteria bacterium RIFCSPHIGHO2_01_FULL_39_32]OGM35385.1 MAG: hypothetical protein A3F01_04615 [Candidatus Woesebacteria bacterium RIFCSPHIGHO2_12_FULL_38_11]OGM65329.1 MAG: hypothetical protein A2893_01215 [Candidatus Woesebacteria bacteri
MAKRRTRAQKESARHSFSISWSPNNSKAKKSISEPDVKGQLLDSVKRTSQKIEKGESAKYSEKDVNLASIKKDIARSLILAGFILTTELVLYLIWKA